MEPMHKPQDRLPRRIQRSTALVGFCQCKGYSMFKKICRVIDRALWPERVKNNRPCNSGWFPIVAAIGSAAKAAAAAAVKAAAAAAAKAGTAAATMGSKAIALAGKGAMAAGKAATGLGKGLMGQSSTSSPLALGKTAAPALNASAMKTGNAIGLAMNQVGKQIGAQIMGGGGNSGGATPQVSQFGSVEQTGGQARPSMLSAGAQTMGGLMNNPLASHVNTTTDTDFQNIAPPQVADYSQEAAPVTGQVGQQQAMPLQSLTPADIEYYRRMRSQRYGV